jgi:hypothetical protein
MIAAASLQGLVHLAVPSSARSDSIHVGRRSGCHPCAPPAYRYIVDRFLQVETAAIWTTLSGGKTLANKADLHEHQKRLDPLQTLALDVAYGGIRQRLVARGSSFDSSDSRFEMRPQTSVRNQPT